MQLKQLLPLAALVGAVSSQKTPTLTDVLKDNKDLSTLADTISKYPALATVLGRADNVTILAPSNDALDALLKAMGDELTDADIQATLQYHVLQGVYYSTDITDTPAFVTTDLANPDYNLVTGGQVVEAALMGKDVMFTSGLLQMSTVTQADLNFTGGVVHIIDTVLTPPMPVSDTALATDLTALAGAAEALDLTDTIDNMKDVTIFAPDNDAFAAIASGLGNLSTSQLTTILSYHVVKGTVGYSIDLKDGMTLKTLAGKDVTITIDSDGAVFVNSAMVTIPDVLVENGVVHVIDNVLNPMETDTPSKSATTGTPAFTGVSSAAKVPFTTEVTPSTTVNLAPFTKTMGSSGGKKTSSSSAIAPMKTAGVGVAALLGAGAAMMNY